MRESATIFTRGPNRSDRTARNSSAAELSNVKTFNSSVEGFAGEVIVGPRFDHAFDPLSALKGMTLEDCKAHAQKVFSQDRMIVGWSVNESHAVGVGFGHTMVGSDAVVTMKIPGLFYAADAVATVSSFPTSPVQPPTSLRPSSTNGRNPSTMRKNCSTSL